MMKSLKDSESVTTELEARERHYRNVSQIVQELGVKEVTVWSYLHRLKLKRHRFPLDRRTWIAVGDVEKIKILREAAQN